MSYEAKATRPAALVDRSVCPLFDGFWYRTRYPDVAGIDPWAHYLAFGASEGRWPNALFDAPWYTARYADVASSGMLPLLHYWTRGAARGYDPNPYFSSVWYLDQYPDVRAAGIDPLLHYWRHGAAEGRRPSALFDSAAYLRMNPDVAHFRWTPLGHYLCYGRKEGRHLQVQEAIRNEQAAPSALAEGGRIAVYTAIFGDYDVLQVPRVVDADCDYVCFTDADISWQDVWQRRAPLWRDVDPTRTARHVKLQPHLYFPQHTWSVWLDGNIRLMTSAKALFPHGDFDIALWRHPYRDCIYAEGEACIQCDKDVEATIRLQMQRYRALGHPENAGLVETNVLVRRHNAPDVVALSNAWWDELRGASRRDQLAFPLVSDRYPVDIAFLAEQGVSARNDPRCRFFAHISAQI